MTSDLSILAENRDAMLLAEVGTWLHMLGKFSEEFVKNRDKYDYKEFYKNLGNSTPLKTILTDKDNWPQKIWRINKPSELKNAPSLLSQFMSKHTEYGTGINLLRILVDAHGRGSGTEKGVLKKENDSSYDNQGEKENYKHIHLASVFGYEAKPIDQDALCKKKYQLYNFLEKQLNILKNSLNPNSQWGADNWLKWRQPFITRLKKEFSTSCGDTRRPINDVTLWEQTAATVAFFRTELAEVLLAGWKDPLDKGNQFKYRILHIGFDGAGFIAQSPRIGDVLARRKLIKNAFDSVKFLVEVEYPLGFEIYRDRNSIVFLVPDVNKLLDLQNDQGKPLRQLIEDKFNIVFSGEINIEISLSSKGSRNVFFVGKELVKPLKHLSPTFSFLKESWKFAGDRCTVCQVRPQGYGAELIGNYKNNATYYKEKAQKRKMCCICMDRLQGRSEKWTKELNRTIWIDEVADGSGPVALIAGRFDLEHWLNGELISTFRNPKDNCGVKFTEIAGEFKASPRGCLKNLPNFMKIADEDVVGNTKTIGGLETFLIKGDDLGEDEFSSILNYEKLALAVWRKPPSFARLRRVWETTQDFWKKSIESKLGNIIGTVASRLVIKVDKSESSGDYHAYDVELKKGIETSLVYDRKNNCFINVHNLCHLAERLELKGNREKLTNEEAAQRIKKHIEKEKNSLDLYEDLAQSKKPSATIRQYKVTIQQHNYLPAIPILVDPEQFIALVPADKALRIANHIRSEYEVQFSKVENRLPLHLNIVFFNQKQPLYASLDAARKMLMRTSRHNIVWKVQSINKTDTQEISTHPDGKLTNRCKQIVLKRIDANTLNQVCEVLVSYGLGDPDKKDVWHPYFFAEKKSLDSQEFSERDYHFCAPYPSNKGSYGMKDMVHVIDLRKGDFIYYSPSTLDFQFLDVTTRRHELVYKNENEMRMYQPASFWATRSFLLEDLVILDRLWSLLSELTSAQLQQLTGLLENWHERWQIKQPGDKTYEAFATYALQRAFGKRWATLLKKDQDDLISWAANNRLFDLLELYLKILKLKPKQDVQSMEART